MALAQGTLRGCIAGYGWRSFTYEVNRLGDVLKLTFVSNLNTSMSAVDFEIKYNGVTKKFTADFGNQDNDSTNDTQTDTFEFDYERTVNTLTVTAARYRYDDGHGNSPTFYLCESWDYMPGDDGFEGSPSYNITWDIQNTNPKATITVPTLTAGQKSTVRWSLSDSDGDAVKTTKLVRYTKATGASSYTQETLISGETTNTSYTDTIPTSAAGGVIYYALTITDGYSTVTVNSDEATVLLSNSAPTTPGKPVIPSTIYGGSSIDISWSAASDADGNLEGYIVERSVNGGSSWTQIYQGTACGTTNTIAYGTASVMYRVKAYDTLGAESAYSTGSQVSVINNNAPTAPSSITVPLTIVGGKAVTITWAETSDPDGDAVAYRLERSTDSGGTWEEIYSGALTSYTGTASSEWTSVMYRVSAVDENGGVSGYVTSSERTVIKNFAPVLTLNNAPAGMNWGVVSAAPSISFSATDPDGDAVSVGAYVDGVFRCSCGASGVFNFADSSGVSFWNQILNGSHTLTITASDGKESVSQSITFSKNVAECSITLKEPMAVADQIKVCVITVNGYFPADRELTVEVTNNALDSSPVWENATDHALSGMNHVFANAVHVNGWAFNFRVRAKGGPSGEGGYITSVQGGFQ